VSGSRPPNSRSSNAVAPPIVPRNPANALPAWLRDWPSFIAGLNLLDDALTTLAAVFAHNWFLVLRKR
jgi:hypothetical protein